MSETLENVKTCRKCKKTKLHSAFCSCGRSEDGLMHVCQVCRWRGQVGVYRRRVAATRKRSREYGNTKESTQLLEQYQMYLDHLKRRLTSALVSEKKTQGESKRARDVPSLIVKEKVENPIQSALDDLRRVADKALTLANQIEIERSKTEARRKPSKKTRKDTDTQAEK